MYNAEKIKWDDDLPINVKIRKIDYIAPHIHEDTVELTMCISGEINFSYYFEEFTLKPGDFILVDHDTHYMYGGKDAVCVSYYLNLDFFEKEFPFIKNLLFVCEGTADSSIPYDTYKHKLLKGILLAILLYMLEHEETDPAYAEQMTQSARKVIKVLMDKFDIIFWYHPDLEISEKAFLRCRQLMNYLFSHFQESISLSDLAEEFGMSEAYITEFARKYMLGFRQMLAYVRMCHAEKLLLYTDKNIIEISEACNFSDPKYLYKTFRYWYGCTPTQFRKQYLNEMTKENIAEDLDISCLLEPITEMTKKHFVDLLL